MDYLKIAIRQAVSVLVIGVGGISIAGSTVVTVKIEDEKEILCPEDGYFDLSGYFRFDRKVHSLEGRQTEVPYEKYRFRSPGELPSFYKMVRSEVGEDMKAAVVYNKRWKNMYSAYRFSGEDVRNRLVIDDSWSLSSSKSAVMLESFGCEPYPFIVNRDSISSKPMSNVPQVFVNRPEFWKKIEIVDLTYSRLADAHYSFLAELQSLRKLALTYHGGEINNPLFMANPRVEELVVWNTSLSNQAFDTLSEFSSVSSVTFNGCDISYMVQGWSDIDRVSKFTNRIRRLRVVNCTKQLFYMLNLCEWSALQHAVFDFVPSVDKVIGKRKYKDEDLDSFVLLVPRERLDLFKKSMGNKMLVYRHELGDFDLVYDDDL